MVRGGHIIAKGVRASSALAEATQCQRQGCRQQCKQDRALQSLVDMGSFKTFYC
jgi:hypothetical protein